MSGDRIVGLIWVTMALTLVGGGLIARRLPAPRLLAMALIWIGVFGVAVAIARALQR